MGAGEQRTLDDLAASLALLEQRVEQLEQGLHRPAAAPREPPERPAAPPTPMDLTLVGRSVLVIGGGYLLRAATELDAVPDALGVALGFAYALVLLVLADRAAGRRRSLDAGLHGATALLVAYPLIAELVLRFHLLEPWMAAVAVGLVGAAGVAVAAHRRDVAIAWVVVAGTLAAAIGTAFATRSIVPYIWTLAALAGAAEWLARRLGRRLLIWPPALGADLLLLLAVPVVLSGRVVAHAATIPILAPLTFLVFAGGAMARAAVDRAATTTAERVQVVVGFAVGFAGGAATAVAAGWGLIYGLAGLLLAAAGSAWALRLQSVPFWTSLWLAVALVSLAVVTGGPPLALACVAIGVALVLLGRRAHDTAELHGVVTLGVAAVTSGLLVAAWRGLIGPPSAAAPGPVAWVVLAALVAAAVLARDDGSRSAWVTKLLALVLTFVHAMGTAAWALIAATSASRPTASALRTVVLAVGAVAVAAIARSPRARPAAVLVYPMLALAVVKMLLEDLAVGTAATQTVGLAVVGAALIVAPKLRPRSPRPEAETATPRGGRGTGSGTAS